MPELPERLTADSHFALDFLALLLSRGAGQAITILVGLFLVRVLAASAFGAYSLATTSIGLAGVLADFGLDPILTRQAAAAPGDALPLLRRALRWRVGLAVALLPVLVGIALAAPDAGRPDLLLIGGIGLLPRGVMRAYAAVLTGIGRARAGAVIEGVGTLAGSGLTVIFVAVAVLLPGADGASAALWALAAGNLLGLIAALRYQIPSPLASHPHAGRGEKIVRLLPLAVPMLIVGLTGALFQALDVYIVRAWYWTPTGPDAVALYAAPFRILNALLLVPTAWGVVALPRYVRQRDRLRRDLRIGLLGGLALSAGCSMLAEPLTRLALGPTYEATAPILVVLAWMALPVCLSAPLVALLMARGQVWRIASCVLAAGLLALAANRVLATAADTSLIDNLLRVALVKVIAMFVLFGFYLLAARHDTTAA